MFDNQTLTYIWRLWVNLFSGLGLPWDSRISAFVGLIVVFYLIGLVFKSLVSTPENQK